MSYFEKGDIAHVRQIKPEERSAHASFLRSSGTYNVTRYTGSVIVSFKDEGTEDIFDGRDTKKARKTCPRDLLPVARRKLDQINQAKILDDLRVPPGNRLEALIGNREGQHSIRINERYRVCFLWAVSGAEEVEIVDYH